MTHLLEKDLRYRIVGAAMAVHDELGPGMLERSYAECLQLELDHLGIPWESEVWVDVVYRGKRIPRAYRMDLVVAGRVVVEIKSVATLDGVHRAQLLTYLRHAHLRVGLLINFHEPRLKEGIIQVVR